MTQMQRRVPTGEAKRHAINQFQGGKPPAEGIMGPVPKNGEALAEAVKKISIAAAAYRTGLAYHLIVCRAAKIAKGLDGATFTNVALAFSDTPSIMALLSLCSFLPEKKEARAYAADSLHSKTYALALQASASIVNGFFASGFLLPAIKSRIDWDEPGNSPHLYERYHSLAERYAVLRRSAFVEMKDLYELGPAQSEVVKANAGGLFVKKFEKFYRENQGWNWIYDRSV